jgi:hypothetical protein
MKTWQILTSMGITIGLYKAVTGKGAVFELRRLRNEENSQYDKYWEIAEISGNKIILK